MNAGLRKSTFDRRLSYECKACGTVAERLRPDRKCEKCGKLLWEALVEDKRAVVKLRQDGSD
jgi:rubredoxin